MKKLRLILIFILVFSCTTPPEKIHQPNRFDNSVTNSTQWSNIEYLTYFGLEKLNVPNVNVSVTYIPKTLISQYGKLNPNTVLEGLIVEHGLNHYQILLNRNLAHHSLRRVLFHELIHLKQSHNGRLVPCNAVSADFMGKHYPDISAVPYRERPWEKEAFEFERYMLRLFDLTE
jgi:hypothetical protein